MKKREIIELKGQSYKIVKSIGDGGSGTVYDVENNSNHFALKVIESNDSKKIKRFQHECEYISKTNNRHVLKCLDYGTFTYRDSKFGKQELLYCLMKLYPSNLRKFMKNDHNVEERLRICLQLSKALKYVHKKGIVHRDIKPENILLDGNNNAILADFGISHFEDYHITKKRDRLANADYHAPEQSLLNGDINIGPHTDIFALGLIFNELFTGRVPQGNAYELIGNMYPLLTRLDDLVYKMTMQDIETRYKDTRDIIFELDFLKIDLKNKLAEIKEELLSNSDNAGVTKKNLKMIIDTASSDILFAKDLFYRDQKKLISLNSNYNMKVGYKVSDFILNLSIQEGFLEICSNIFYCESVIYNNGKSSYENLNLNNPEHLILYRQMVSIINEFPVFDDFDLSGRILKFFSSCQDYHCREIIHDCKEIPQKFKKNLEDAPILWIFQHLAYYLKDSFAKLVRTNHEIEFDILINWDRTRESFFEDKNFGLIDDYEEERNKKNDKNLLLLKEKYPQMRFSFDKSNNSAKVIFPKYKHYNTFKMDSLKIAKPYYIFEGDVLNMMRIVRQSKDAVEISFSFFDIENVIPKLLGLVKIN